MTLQIWHIHDNTILTNQVADRDADKDANQYADKDKKEGSRWKKMDQEGPRWTMQDYCKITARLSKIEQKLD